MQKIKINASLEWVRDYLRRVKHLFPYNRLVRIRAKATAPINAKEPYNACILHDEVEDTYEIILVTNWQEKYKYFDGNKCHLRHSPFSRIDLLNHLAHELAHMLHWRHTPEHKILESKITTLFMKQLLRDGYVSEEDELNRKRRKK